jgi:FKBP-type peptidyl-prolyl cis-trans isomerase
MKYFIVLFFFTLIVVACNNDVNKKEFKKNGNKFSSKKDAIKFNESKENLKIFEKGKVENTKILDNGVVIKWLVNNKGRKIENGEMILLEYRLALPDGKIIDGNNKLELPFIPFVLGYSMQTPGWDTAIRELSVGDFAKIEIPSDLAYGVKGIKGIIPSNSDNWLYVKVHSSVSPEVNENGVTSWKLKNGKEKTVYKDRKELMFHAIVSTPNKSAILNTYLSNSPIRFKTGQTNIVPGLRKLLMNANKGDKYYVILDSKQAYGSKGYLDLIQANESVFFNIDIIDSRGI